MRLHVDADVTPVAELLHRMAGRAADMRPAMREVIELLEEETARRFARQGEGDWPRLSMATIERRLRAGVSSRRMLVQTGALRRSLTANTRGTERDVDRGSLRFATTIPYARHVARRRNPLPEVDRQLQRRMSDLIGRHVRHP